MNVYKNVIADVNGCDVVSIEEGEHQNRVNFGDLLFTQSSETLEEVGLTSVWLNDDTPLLNSFCFGFHFDSSSLINPRFAAYSMRAPSARKRITREGQGATRYNLSSNRLKKVKILYPSHSEQDKIAGLLSLLETRIEKQCEIIDQLKKYKRGLSDELFGKNETTEEWTTVPFGEVFELLQNNTFSRDEMSSESGTAYNIHYGDVLIKYGAVVDLSKSKVPYIRSDVSLSKYAQSSYLRDGDIVIADTAEDYTVGKAVEIVGVADEKALSGLHTISCRPKISFAPMYLGYFINSKRFRTQIFPLVQGTKVSSISKSEILKTSIAFPSFGVQSQIASMLYALDHRIDICQACVQGLVRTKEALLQQLFI